MRNATPIWLFFSLLIAVTFKGYSQKFHVIEKGKIKGDFKITLVEQNVVLNPDKFFSIIDLKLQTNNPIGNEVSLSDEVNCSRYQKKNLNSYKITIERLSDHKIYHGRIAFYTVFNKPYIINDPTVSSYQIGIPESDFTKTHDGITSYRYEYYDKKKGGTARFPTWAIWFSDVPFSDNIKTPAASITAQKIEIKRKKLLYIGEGLKDDKLEQLIKDHPSAEKKTLMLDEFAKAKKFKKKQVTGLILLGVGGVTSWIFIGVPFGIWGGVKATKNKNKYNASRVNIANIYNE